MAFQDGPIQGVVITPIRKFRDDRGWLAEVFRSDEIAPEYQPAMGYLSTSLPGVVRGPHEHEEQADLFVFLGPGEFKITLWDNRKALPSYGSRMVVFGGEGNPIQVLIPPGVVHAYRNLSLKASVVLNFPNQLFQGEGKKQPIDEIRHEDDPETPFKPD